VLFVRFSAYGDILMCLPALASFRRAFPESEIHFLAATRYAHILRAVEGICCDRLITYDRSPGLSGLFETVNVAARLSAERYDAVFDWQANPRSRILTGFLGVRRRFTFDRRVRVHQLDKCYFTLRKLGIKPPREPAPIELASPDEDSWADEVLSSIVPNSVPVALGMGGIWTTKLWPEERFHQLMELVLEEIPAHFFLIGDDRDRERTAKLAADFPGNATDLAGRTTILQAAALVRRCAIFIGNDTSTMHLAWVQGIPTIGIFGATDPLRTGPLGANSFSFGSSRLLCHPCFSGRCPFGGPLCLEVIRAEDVAAKALGILEPAQAAGHD